MLVQRVTPRAARRLPLANDRWRTGLPSPPVNTTETFLIAMVVIFTVPYAVWRLGRTDHVAPLVVVQILADIALGPGLLGAAWPQAYALVFNPPVVLALNGVAWWGVMLFVFIAGMELDLRQVWAHRRETGLTAGLALLVPLLLGSVAALLLSGPWPLFGAAGGLVGGAGWIGPGAARWQFVLGIGMACAVTALPILLLLMEKLAILRLSLGQRILRYASLDDVLIWGVLALILLDWHRVGLQVAFLLGFALASVLLRRLLQAVPEADRWPICLV